jgi:hypothetical protein
LFLVNTQEIVMDLKRYKVRIEVGEYYGGGTNGAWTSSTDKVFYTEVMARWPQDAVNMCEAQYGGQERCRVTYLGEA